MQPVYSASSPADRVTGHSLGGGLTPLQRCSLCILQLPSRLDHRTLVGRGLTPLQRCSLCILQLPSWLGHRTLVGGSSPLCRDAVCVFCSSPADWGIGHSLGGGLNPLQRCSLCILQLPSWFRWVLSVKITFICQIEAVCWENQCSWTTTLRCSSYWKGSLWIAHDYGRQLYLLTNNTNISNKSRSNSCSSSSRTIPPSPFFSNVMFISLGIRYHHTAEY